MRIGMNISIDVTKLDKARFYKGKKGTYAKLTCFIDTEKTSEYGDNGVLSQEVSKDERENGVKLPILGNAKVFFTVDSDSGQGGNRPSDGYVPDDEVPF